MIELVDDQFGSSLAISFPDLHEAAALRVSFHRTFRVPDDGRLYPLPPGFGMFPLTHVDDYISKVPDNWRRRGGVFFPMYQAEAMWMRFENRFSSKDEPYPFAVKLATGKINVVNGKPWRDDFSRKPQDYVVTPDQLWVDGYCVREGLVRQFVAIPLGKGYSVEEQLTGAAEHGGLQLSVVPMKAERYEALKAEKRSSRPKAIERSLIGEILPGAIVNYSPAEIEMSFAPGGRLSQQIYKDRYGFEAWDWHHRSRCFVHVLNSTQYESVTGQAPPCVPPSAKSYAEAGLPWFEHYREDLSALSGTKTLEMLNSIQETHKQQNDDIWELASEESVTPSSVIQTVPKRTRVREGR